MVCLYLRKNRISKSFIHRKIIMTIINSCQNTIKNLFGFIFRIMKTFIVIYMILYITSIMIVFTIRNFNLNDYCQCVDITSPFEPTHGFEIETCDYTHILDVSLIFMFIIIWIYTKDKPTSEMFGIVILCNLLPLTL